MPGARSYNLYRSEILATNMTSMILVGAELMAYKARTHVLATVNARGHRKRASYRDLGLSPGTEYFYQLEACNSSGCSARSPTGSGRAR